MSETTLLWHDYETWGVDPRRDRPSQFAAIRTNLDLEIIGEPIELFCQPSTDFIPHPQSVLITGLVPQVAKEKGVPEADFFAQINSAFSEPGTCGVGYNSIRFDDEVTRFGLYRNFFDPYAREWQNGNSRWDIVDLVRMTYALRPEGIIWPEREPGIPSFRLDKLSVATGISHANARDALADVHATLGMARLIRDKQLRLYHYYFDFRKKQAASNLINLASKDIILHISGMYPSAKGCIAPVIPLAQHPRNKNEFTVFDLRQNPDQLLQQSAEEIGKTLFTPGDQLPEGTERVALKGIHINKSPAIAPINTLSDELAEKWAINWNEAESNRAQILADASLTDKIRRIYEAASSVRKTQDADVGLYGGFLDNKDRRICDQIHNQSVADRLTATPAFRDTRLQTLYPRYLARNWPEQLSDAQRETWLEFCQARLIEGDFGCQFTLDDYFEALAQAQAELTDNDKITLLDQLNTWVEEELSLQG